MMAACERKEKFAAITEDYCPCCPFQPRNDPWEMHDRVDDPAYAQTKADLLARLKRMQHELGDALDLDYPKPALKANA